MLCPSHLADHAARSSPSGTPSWPPRLHSPATVVVPGLPPPPSQSPARLPWPWPPQSPFPLRLGHQALPPATKARPTSRSPHTGRSSTIPPYFSPVAAMSHPCAECRRPPLSLLDAGRHQQLPRSSSAAARSSASPRVHLTPPACCPQLEPTSAPPPPPPRLASGRSAHPCRHPPTTSATPSSCALRCRPSACPVHRSGRRRAFRQARVTRHRSDCRPPPSNVPN